MYNSLEIGTVPAGEECQQIGTRDYDAQKARIEATVYKRQLIRMRGEPPPDCWLVVQGQPHDFGTYYEVVVKWEGDNEAAVQYAYDMERNAPEFWDTAAIGDLEHHQITVKAMNRG
jgi:hypothetical protein